MLLRILWLAVMAILLVACAQVKTDKAVTQSLVVGSVQKDEPMNDEVLVEPSNLSSELLYSLLGGEIAGQRGDVSMASAFYLSAAKRSQDPGIALRAAQIALYNKDVAAAKLAVDILVEDKNVSVQAKRLALTVYLRAGDVEKSLSQIRLLLEKNEIPKRNALLAIGDVVSRHANKNTAISVMTVLVGENVKEAGVFLARSQIMSNFSLFDQAQKDANKAVELDASWQTGYVQLAQVLERKGDTQAALLVLKEASEKLKARQLLMVYAQLLAKNKQYLAAKEQFLTLLKHEKNYPDARFSLGLVYLKLDDAENAKATFKGLYEDNAFRSKVAFYLGRIAHHQKQDEEALGWFDKVERSENYVEAQVTIAIIKARSGEVQGARSVIQRLRNEFPEVTSRFYLLEAELLMDARQYDVLYLLLTEAVNENPSDLALRFARSIAATEIDQLVEAEKDLLYVLDKTPSNASALNALGYTLASKTFRFKEARKYLAKALSLRPDDAAILDSMGWLNYREGQYEQALVLLERAYKKTPEGEIAAHLGEALWMLGRQMEARVIWQEALKRDADNRYLIEVVKRLK
jgi:tetratricopeptide (TPR) repeat protein